MARHGRYYTFYQYKQYKSRKNTVPTLRNCFMSSVLKTVKSFLLKNTHAKPESNTKRNKVNILKMIRTVLTDVVSVGLEWKITMPQESNTSTRRNNTKYSNKESLKNIKEKNQTASREQLRENTRKKRNAAKIRTHVMTRVKGIEKETGKQ